MTNQAFYRKERQSLGLEPKTITPLAAVLLGLLAVMIVLTAQLTLKYVHLASYNESLYEFMKAEHAPRKVVTQCRVA